MVGRQRRMSRSPIASTAKCRASNERNWPRADALLPFKTPKPVVARVWTNRPGSLLSTAATVLAEGRGMASAAEARPPNRKWLLQMVMGKGLPTLHKRGSRVAMPQLPRRVRSMTTIFEAHEARGEPGVLLIDCAAALADVRIA